MRVLPTRMRCFGIGRIVGLLLLVALLALRIWDPGFIEALRQKSFDIYPLMHPHATRQNLVAAVDTDELSLRSLDDAAAAPREG